MNARNYRVSLNLSPLDFPPIDGLGESSVSYQSEPFLKNSNVLLTITKKFVLTNMNTNKVHEILSAKSDYEIPVNQIKSREDVYEFYKDAISGLSEAYQYAQTQLPALPTVKFPAPPIEHYKGEIDRVFNLINRQN